ncbi:MULTISPECIES: GntR family transcriptional regulator [Edwardsiella]|uniref:Regulatory protein, GntR family n=2 Tax=Edwardsiella anguillarum TaxID=1821960 RepID=A0A076LED0_9GAMM|nr:MULTISPECIES: GntR family transcriptional regulator [Edwardsiella]AKM47620.1 GntR family transcriptional regulator [Edwardsiella sp. EA181011]GAJ69097.1 transcriptional regulator [Edwardsiella piscicida]AIJ06531.1 regulatory protein, GntR family [Edwardsiella anguillarum ET080813]AKR78080.1 GntR family transcriptional regulator [Edwardsiella sp. LADL05-105]KAB0593182.1 GntR family transcriptional regulator [Edwardsiella anguillarum]
MSADPTPLLHKLRDDLAQSGSMPIYLRFNESIRQAIAQGMLQPGDFLPSERAFTDALKISRITVRKALACLEQDDIIGRGRGFGTQIKQVPMSSLAYSLANIKGFSGEVAMQGRQPGTRWLSRELVPASATIADKLDIAIDTPVYRLERIRTVDGQALSVAISYVIREAIDDCQAIGESLYDYLRARQIQFGRLSSQIGACLADPSLQQKLGIGAPTAMLVIRQVLSDRARRPLEYSINYCRGDMYEYTAEE